MTWPSRPWLACLVLALAQPCLAASEPDPAPDLELRLQASVLRAGLPQHFVLLLRNVSDHDLRVPRPALGCSSRFGGALLLQTRFVPLHPGGTQLDSGCAADIDHWPDALRRAAEWTHLHPGESLRLEATSAQLFLPDQGAGTYEIWAEYQPPFVTEADRQTLHTASISYPEQALASTHLRFVKQH